MRSVPALPIVDRRSHAAIVPGPPARNRGEIRHHVRKVYRKRKTGLPRRTQPRRSRAEESIARSSVAGAGKEPMWEFVAGAGLVPPVVRNRMDKASVRNVVFDDQDIERESVV